MPFAIFAMPSAQRPAAKRRHEFQAARFKTMSEIGHADLAGLIPEVQEIAREAGRAILAIYATDFAVENKTDNSPLTAADMAAHRAICRRLSAVSPGIPILSEESAQISFNERRRWRQYWLVDPLDGTREFIKRNGDFSVNIALVENRQAILGVIHIPVTNITYSAALGRGARRTGADNHASPIRVKKTSPGRITVAGSRSRANQRLRAFIAGLDRPEVLSVGSALKFCLIAEGRADIYPRFGPTSEWDTAAAQAIVEEAGGIVVDTDFRPLRYNSKASLLNPSFLVIADTAFDWRRYL